VPLSDKAAQASSSLVQYDKNRNMARLLSSAGMVNSSQAPSLCNDRALMSCIACALMTMLQSTALYKSADAHDCQGLRTRSVMSQGPAAPHLDQGWDEAIDRWAATAHWQARLHAILPGVLSSKAGQHPGRSSLHSLCKVVIELASTTASSPKLL
jgi:hypothetical protein